MRFPDDVLVNKQYISYAVKELIACRKLIFEAALLWQDNYGTEDAEIYKDLNQEYHYEMRDTVKCLLENAPDEVTRCMLAEKLYWEFDAIPEDIIIVGLNADRNYLFQHVSQQRVTVKCLSRNCTNTITRMANTREEREIFRNRVRCDECLEKQRKYQRRQELKNQKWFDFNDPETLELMPYEMYLKTPHWKNLRITKFNEVGKQCQFCDSTYNLVVHHRNYARRGCEKLSDLTVLCRDCHDALHKARGKEPFHKDEHEYK